MIVHTESGSVYELAGDRVRRINPAAGKRGDGDWQTLLAVFPNTPTVGHPMVLVMESLAEYGADDIGTPQGEVGPTTTRRTTPVLLIEGAAS